MEHITEYDCECRSCGAKFCYSDKDVMRDKRGRWGDLASAATLMSGSRLEKTIALNHKNSSYQEDFNKCPKCGSRKVVKTESDYYVDENGDYVEGYEPDLLEKASEVGGTIAKKTGDTLHAGCLVLLLIPTALVLYAVLNLLKAIFALFF